MRILQYTGADAAMIGRGVRQPLALPAGAGRPGGGRRSAPAAAYGAVRYGHGAVPHQRPPQRGEDRLPEARKQYCWYLKGVPYAGYWKERICHVETMAELEGDHRGIKRDLN